MIQIGNYTYDETPIARGGMGQIFRGHDNLGNKVAIKQILPEFASDMMIIKRIEKEVEFLVKIDHPSIVKLYAAFREPTSQCYYIVMEMVDGENIEQHVMRHGPIPEQRAVDLMCKILDALQFVHNANVVHRDIKPSNIMLRPDDSICLLDFGVAKDMENSGGTMMGDIIGTSGYMSPEQANGYSINSRSDIYSLGCVFFYMLTGHHAFNTLDSEFATKDAVINNPFPRLSQYKQGISERIQRVLDKATDKNMMKRYGSCYEMMAALSAGTVVTGNNAAPIKVTIGRENCDIIIADSDRRISRHHADVELREMTGYRCYVLTDCSSNGTLVNGKMVNKSSVNIPENQTPDVTLAGSAEGSLNWKLVVDELTKRAKALQMGNLNPSQGDSAADAGNAEGNTHLNGGSGRDNAAARAEAESAYEPKKATWWLVAAAVFAILGGLFGLAFGITVYNAKIKLPDGTKVKKYKESHRTIGLVIAILSAISSICWKVAMV